MWIRLAEAKLEFGQSRSIAAFENFALFIQKARNEVIM